jgi:outer membrane protein assembly factor BamD
MRMKRFLLPLLSVALVSCSVKDVDYTQYPADTIYDKAYTALENKDYSLAARIFTELEKNFPYADLALKGQILGGYALYLNKQYDEAAETFDLFAQLHPGHARVPYALYMRGMCAYLQIPIVGRDQESAEESLRIFEDLILRFPQTQYAADAKVKIVLIKDHLAGKELAVGRYYLNAYSYIAATNRFKNIIELYKDTDQVPEALYRLVECYTALGLDKEVNYYKEKLEKYPSSIWRSKAKNFPKQ